MIEKATDIMPLPAHKNETDTEDDYFSIDAKDKTEEPAETKD